MSLKPNVIQLQEVKTRLMDGYPALILLLERNCDLSPDLMQYHSFIHHFFTRLFIFKVAEHIQASSVWKAEKDPELLASLWY